MQDKAVISSYNRRANYILWSYRNILAGRDTYSEEWTKEIPNMTHQYLLIPYRLVTETTAQEVAENGKKLVVYTVDNTWDMQALYDKGVRMVMTNEIPLMTEWFKSINTQQKE
jgi:glycerophosphoryl diester phosphodiesterase